MTTTFQRQALISAAKQAIASMEAELANHQKQVDEFIAQSKQRWIVQSKPQLKLVRDRLSKELRKDGVIELSRVSAVDINRLFYREPTSYDIGRQVGYLRNDFKKQFVNRLNAYKGVLKLLESADGDTLSINQLKTMGLTKLGELFRIAASEGGLLDDNPLV